LYQIIQGIIILRILRYLMANFYYLCISFKSIRM